MALACFAGCPQANAGGPRWTAGAAYFNSSVMGQPVLWVGGSMVYFTDQGPLSAYESNQAAQAMVAAAALPWTQVPTASVSITFGGSLAEDVTGAGVSGSLRAGTVVWPGDVGSLAVPVPILFDADGSILNTIVGAGASDASGCLTNSVTSVSDGFSVEGNLNHAILILNGLCAQDAGQVMNMQYLLTREFGRVLGLDWSQANDNVFTGNPRPTPSDVAGWPLMHPVNVNCGGENYSCIPNAGALRMDDRAALGRLYPSSNFSADTVRVYGTLRFANGTGMQGVLVTATLLETGTDIPATDMVASCVSGAGFRGNAGNVVTGTEDAWGNPLARFGSSNWWVAGEYELSGLEIPAGLKSADYEITFTAVNPAYTGDQSVGPELPGAPVPSGTLATIYLRGVKAGQTWPETVNVATSAMAALGMGGSFVAANNAPAAGNWSSTINGYGDAEWFEMAARPNRVFSVITVAKDEIGAASQRKAMPVIGAWFAGDSQGLPPDFAAPVAFDSSSVGTTVLEVQTPGPDGAQGQNGAQNYPMVFAVADARGDGRPDYAYEGRVLYADRIAPAVMPPSGGVASIFGMGFVAGDTVTINGTPADVMALQAQQIVARVPESSVLGVADVQVNDPSGAYALMSGAIAYGRVPADTLQRVSSFGGGVVSSGAVGAQAPGSFAVQATDWRGNLLSGAEVTFSATNGGTLSVCAGVSTCTVAASTSGYIATTLIPTPVGTTTVTASIAGGASAQSQWTANLAAEAIQFAQISLTVQSGATLHWPVSVTALANGLPSSAVRVQFELNSGSANLAQAYDETNASGIAGYSVPIPYLQAGTVLQVQACLPDMTCTSIPVIVEAPADPLVVPIAGTSQTVPATTQFSPLQLQIFDGIGEASASAGNPIAGVSVTFDQTLYAYEPPSGRKTPPTKILATSTTTVASDATGVVTLQPLQQAGIAGRVAITVSINGSIVANYWLSALPLTGAQQAGRPAPVL